MTVDEVMRQLEKMGTAQNRKVYPRHGAREPMFGVSYADLNKLARQLGTDQDLAVALWSTGNHDARVLATKLADPARFTATLADRWIRDCDNYVLVEAVAPVVAGSPAGVGRATAWRKRKDEWIASAGWAVTASLVLSGQADDATCRQWVDEIERHIHERPNRVRHEMNAVLIAIGVAQPGVRDDAIEAAQRIGKVDVDHGATSCKTPDAVSYIERSVARQGKARAR